MISIIELGPSIVGCRAEGKIERADLDALFAEIDRKKVQGGGLCIYAELGDLTGISLEAIWQDVRYWFEHWRIIKDITRAAVVTDSDWVTRSAQWKEKVFSGMEIRVFRMAQREEAKAWIHG
jgi:hypothetical protein